MAEYIKVPAGVYDMVTRCMEQEFPDNVAIRYVAEDGKTVVEKKYREYAQDIRRMVAYLKAEVPDIKGQRIVLLSRNCYEFCVASYGIILENIEFHMNMLFRLLQFPQKSLQHRISGGVGVYPVPFKRQSLIGMLKQLNEPLIGFRQDRRTLSQIFRHWLLQ